MNSYLVTLKNKDGEKQKVNVLHNFERLACTKAEEIANSGALKGRDWVASFARLLK